MRLLVRNWLCRTSGRRFHGYQSSTFPICSLVLYEDISIGEVWIAPRDVQNTRPFNMESPQFGLQYSEPHVQLCC